MRDEYQASQSSNPITPLVACLCVAMLAAVVMIVNRATQVTNLYCICDRPNNEHCGIICSVALFIYT